MCNLVVLLTSWLNKIFSLSFLFVLDDQEHRKACAFVFYFLSPRLQVHMCVYIYIYIYIYLYLSHVQFFFFLFALAEILLEKGSVFALFYLLSCLVLLQFSMYNKCTSCLVLLVGHKVKSCWLKESIFPPFST